MQLNAEQPRVMLRPYHLDSLPSFVRTAELHYTLVLGRSSRLSLYMFASHL